MSWRVLRCEEGRGFVAKCIMRELINRQVIIFGECYVEDYGKIKRILSPEDIFNISIKGEYHE